MEILFNPLAHVVLTIFKGVCKALLRDKATEAERASKQLGGVQGLVCFSNQSPSLHPSGPLSLYIALIL